MEKPVDIRWVKALSLSLFAILTLSAITAGAAHANVAPRVEVKAGGVFHALGVTEIKQLAGESTTVGVFQLPRLGLTFENPAGGCSATGTVVGSEPGQPTTIEDGELLCEDVTIKELPGCNVHTADEGEGTIAASGLVGGAVWTEKEGEKAGVLLEPDPATGEFTELVIERKSAGTKCAFSGEYPVAGEVIGEIVPEKSCGTGGFEEGELVLPVLPILNWWNNEVPRKEQEIEQLRVGDNPATLEVEATFHLVPKQKMRVCGS